MPSGVSSTRDASRFRVWTQGGMVWAGSVPNETALASASAVRLVPAATVADARGSFGEGVL